MATGTLAPILRELVLDSNGKPISGALINTYIAGTSTPVATYTDVALSIPNSNPIVADSAGRWWAFLTPGQSYKFVVTDALGGSLYTQDNVLGVPQSGANVDVPGTAGSTITAGQAVYLSAGDGGKTAGQWYPADSANTYSSTTNWVGIAPAAIGGATSGTIRLVGSVTGLSSLSPGTKYYVGTAGALTSSAPTNARLLGESDTTTSLVLTGNPPPFGPFALSTLTAHGVVLGEGTSPITTTAVGTTGQLLTGVSTADPTFQNASSVGASMVLLKANSGTDTSAGATNVDTIAISGLTAKDLLWVKINATSVTQATANIGLYNVTDSVVVNTAVSSLAAAAVLMLNFDVAQSQASATSIWARDEGKDTAPTVYGNINVATFATAWTGGWTLALRHGGVTSGGTLQWKWSVYKLSGQ
jgi:hypothetical protein